MCMHTCCSPRPWRRSFCSSGPHLPPLLGLMNTRIGHCGGPPTSSCGGTPSLSSISGTASFRYRTGMLHERCGLPQKHCACQAWTCAGLAEETETQQHFMHSRRSLTDTCCGARWCSAWGPLGDLGEQQGDLRLQYHCAPCSLLLSRMRVSLAVTNARSLRFKAFETVSRP